MKVNQSYCRYCKKTLSTSDNNDYHQSCFDDVQSYDPLFSSIEWYEHDPSTGRGDKVYSHEIEFFKSLIPFCGGFEYDEENFKWITSNNISIKDFQIISLYIYFRKDLDEFPVEFSEIKKLKRLESLSIEFYGKIIPDVLFSLSDLKLLSLKISQVSIIPDLFNNFINLDYLSIVYFNGVLPESYFHLRGLKRIVFLNRDNENFRPSRMIDFIRSFSDLELVYLECPSIDITSENREDINFLLKFYDLLTEYCEIINYFKVYKREITDTLNIRLKSNVTGLTTDFINHINIKSLILRYDGEIFPSPFFSFDKIRNLELTIPKMKVIPGYIFSKNLNVTINSFIGERLPELLYQNYPLGELILNDCSINKFIFPKAKINTSKIIFNRCLFQHSREEMETFLKDSGSVDNFYVKNYGILSHEFNNCNYK